MNPLSSTGIGFSYRGALIRFGEEGPDAMLWTVAKEAAGNWSSHKDSREGAALAHYSVSSRLDPSLSSPSPLRDSFLVERLSVGKWRPPSRTCLGPQVHKPFKPCWQMPVDPERAL
jgi:hypothetical protein